jgi:carbamate kinase
LTDVDAVYENWGKEDERAYRALSPMHAAKLDLAKGSMGPKVQAACAFAQETGNTAIIGNLMQAETMLKGESGTHIASNVKEVTYY